MEWQLVLLLFVGGVLVLMVSGLPVAFCFILLSLIAAFILWHGEIGLELLILSMFKSVATFTLLPLPLFILMGEVLVHSGIVSRMMDALDKWLGRLPGRLSLLAVGGGTLMATVTGVSLASCAMLGKVLVPEMEKRSYKKQMTLGPILASGGLAAMIPPSVLAILVGIIGYISIGKILIAIIIPGLVLAALYATYIIVRCYLQPSIAPPYDVSPPPLIERIAATVRYVLPMAFIVFVVVGGIFLGMATPTEAAALGAVSTFILAAAYKRLNWETVKKSMVNSVQLTVMILFIIAGAKAFSQVLAFSGATAGLINFTVGLPLEPILILIAMQVTLLILGTFLDPVAMLMIMLPTYMSVILELGFDSVWFGVIILLNLEVAVISPPFGMLLYTMKGVAPPGTTMSDVIQASLPFVGLILLVMVLVIAFPAVALWLPGLMR